MRSFLLLICMVGMFAGSASAQQPVYVIPQSQPGPPYYWSRSAAPGYYRPWYYRPGSSVPGYAAPSNYWPAYRSVYYTNMPNYSAAPYPGYTGVWQGYSPFAYLRDGSYYY